MKKLCLFCKHFYFSPAERGYSELTPGVDVTIECNKNKWNKYDMEQDLSTTLLLAEMCKFYVIDEWAKERYGLEE